MSKARRQRLSKIADMWEEDLGNRVGALAQARGRAEQASRVHMDAHARTEAARASRADLMGGASADEWRAREAWIATCTSREERAAAAVNDARRGVDDASRAVIAAQQKVERMKLVLARLAAQEALAERRVEQRDEDEIAARISHTQNLRSGSAQSRAPAMGGGNGGEGLGGIEGRGARRSR